MRSKETLIEKRLLGYSFSANAVLLSAGKIHVSADSVIVNEELTGNEIFEIDFDGSFEFSQIVEI